MGVRVAVLTNASLLWLEDVRSDLLEADLVSIKIDAVSEGLWRFINRPHKELDTGKVLEGVEIFSEGFNGTLIPETMVIAEKFHSYRDEAKKIASFLEKLRNLDKAYIAIPVRPPAESWVEPPEESLIIEFYTVFTEELGSARVELLIAPSGEIYGDISRPIESIIFTASIHPIKEKDLEEFLMKSGVDWNIVKELLSQGKLTKVIYRGETFYIANR